MSAPGIEVRLSFPPPQGLLEALGQARCKYSNICHLFHLLQVDVSKFVGVAGDGCNATYEFFVWDGEILEITDIGYGATEWALRDVLNQECPK